MQQRLQEMRKIINDPIYFAQKYFYIISLDGGKQLIKVYQKQRDLINAMFQKRRVIALSCRQSGKCVQGETKIKIRNKNTGEIQQISIQQFYKMMENNK